MIEKLPYEFKKNGYLKLPSANLPFIVKKMNEIIEELNKK